MIQSIFIIAYLNCLTFIGQAELLKTGTYRGYDTNHNEIELKIASDNTFEYTEKSNPVLIVRGTWEVKENTLKLIPAKNNQLKVKKYTFRQDVLFPIISPRKQYPPLILQK